MFSSMSARRSSVFEKLVQDHRIVEKRLSEIERTVDKDAALREQLFKELQVMLEVHETFEEEVLYPEIDQIPQIVSMIGNAYEAHAEFDTIMRELSDSPVTDDEWMRRIGELKEMVREHVRMEEESLFPAAHAKLAESRAEELGRQLDARRNYL